MNAFYYPRVDSSGGRRHLTASDDQSQADAMEFWFGEDHDYYRHGDTWVSAEDCSCVVFETKGNE